MNQPKRSNFKVCMRLIGLVKPLIGFMILAILMGLAGHLCASFITILGGYAILEILHFPVALSLTAIFVTAVVFAVLRGALHYGEQSCNHYIAFKILAILRDKVFRALRRLAPARLEGRDKGNLISVITSDIELLEVFYAHTISPVAIALLMSVLMSLFIGSFSPLLGLLAAAAYLTVGVVVPLCVSHFGRSDGLTFRGQAGDLSSCVLDSLRGLPEILQFHAGEKRLEEINSRTDSLSETEGVMKRKAGINAAVTNTVILLFDLAMLLVSASLYQNGAVNFSGVLIPVIALMSSFGPVTALAALGSTLQNTFASGNRVLDILDETPVTEDICGQPVIEFTGAEADHVDFSYGNERILDNVSADFPENAIVGITGKSGSGKSTLLKLLMRFWNTDSGTIEISDRNINRVNTDNLRGMQSFVTQETQLFHDSIESNIRIARLDATHEEIEEACRKASIHDFIAGLPQGYQTPVGELGGTLSGGEKQRIGLARAFLHDAPMMLLDEPTSNLDSLNEAIILRSIDRERHDKTVVLVSHRPSTMRIADSVYCVENGRVS